MAIKILEVCHIRPSSNSPVSINTESSSLPLTFFDIFNLKFPPVQGILFYQLTQASPAYFNSIILPKFKLSLSLALFHFLPISGNVKWPPNSAKPIITYNTPDDGIALTVAESDADLDHLCDDVRDAVESRPYAPPLLISDTTASIISFQITLFPNKGFTVGHTINHSILDGKSISDFLNAWAHICKQLVEDGELIRQCLLPMELIPHFDRTVIRDPEGLDMLYLKAWSEIKLFPDSDACPNSLRTIPIPDLPPPDVVRTRFEFSREDIQKLREMVLSQWDNFGSEEDRKQMKPIRLSSFLLTFAYTFVCLVKAKGFKCNDKVRCGFGADCRARLDPPIPSNYIGNCVTSCDALVQVEDLMKDDGVACVAKKLNETIEDLKDDVLKDAREKVRFLDMEEVPIIHASGSSRFGMYGADFGWGRPKYAEITNIDLIDAFSMMESKDGRSGGVEVGIVLKKREMKIFSSLFVDGLKSIKINLHD